LTSDAKQSHLRAGLKSTASGEKPENSAPKVKKGKDAQLELRKPQTQGTQNGNIEIGGVNTAGKTRSTGTPQDKGGTEDRDLNKKHELRLRINGKQKKTNNTGFNRTGKARNPKPKDQTRETSCDREGKASIGL